MQDCAVMQSKGHESISGDAPGGRQKIFGVLLFGGFVFILLGLVGLEHVYSQLKSEQSRLKLALDGKSRDMELQKENDLRQVASLENSFENTRDKTQSFGTSASDLLKYHPPVSGTSAPKATPALITFETSLSSPSPAASQSGKTWSLGDAQQKKIVEQLRKHPGRTITICTAQTDPKSAAFAAGLKHSFEQAGWSVEKQAAYPNPPAGLSIASGTFPWPETLADTAEALIAAGLHVTPQIDSKIAGDKVVLIIGSPE
ncbi:MAG TPA: hypothetical protein VG733_03390 [Chthoniobacteraceae bacterium]|nr:hypothetical protein [Chthoniobacteraceae bacterium]